MKIKKLAIQKIKYLYNFRAQKAKKIREYLEKYFNKVAHLLPSEEEMIYKNVILEHWV